MIYLKRVLDILTSGKIWILVMILITTNRLADTGVLTSEGVTTILVSSVTVISLGRVYISSVHLKNNKDKE